MLLCKRKKMCFVSESGCLFECLTVCLFDCLTVRLTGCLFDCLTVFLTVFLTACLTCVFVCFFYCVFACLLTVFFLTFSTHPANTTNNALTRTSIQHIRIRRHICATTGGQSCWELTFIRCSWCLSCFHDHYYHCEGVCVWVTVVCV